MSSQETTPHLCFDGFELQPAERRLLVAGTPASLGPRAFDLLLALAESAGRLVSKDALLERVWPNVVVVENNLHVQVSTLRNLLGSDAIATVGGKGYRLTCQPVVRAPVATPLSSDAASTCKHLPHNLGPLFGREQELSQLQVLLTAGRLVTVTGPGGVGKTRLMNECALNVADRFADGVWWVELATLSESDMVAAAVASTLRIEVKDAPSASDALARHLRDKHILLLLDNCEHLVEPVATLVNSLLAFAPRLQVMTSSQEILGVSGEQVFRVRSLPVPSDESPTAQAAIKFGAIEMFTARARLGEQDFRCDDENAPVITAICRRLDGIPLAIEMAAARIAAFGLASVARLLDERFLALTAGQRGAVPRHRTLQATLDWSFNLLAERERIVFRRLAAFVGGFSLDAGTAAAADDCIDPIEVVDAIRILVTKSLLVVDRSQGQWRYRLLEAARAYALDRLAQADEIDLVSRKAAAHYVAVFQTCFDDWTRLSDDLFDARYAPDLGNLRVALDWSFGPQGDRGLGLLLTGLSGPLWIERLMISESERRLATAFASVEPQTPPTAVASLYLVAGTFYYTRLNEQSISALRSAAAMMRSLGENVGAGYSLLLLGNTLAALGYSGAEEALAEAQALLAGSDRPRLLALLPKTLAMFFYMRGMQAQTDRENLRALALARAGGYEILALTVEENLADSWWLAGDLPRALAAARSVIEQCKRVKAAHKVNWGWVYANYCGMLIEADELAEAAEVVRMTMPYLCETKSMRSTMDHFALRLAKSGCTEEAARIHGWANNQFAGKHITRQPNELRAMTSTAALLRQQLPTELMAQLCTEGAELSEQEVCRLALL
ncbi:hypothetical protein BH11PSE10_BH11PSE10_16970 [soil metagenome]